MEPIFGSYPVRAAVPGDQEVYGQADGDASECGKVRAVAGEGDGEIPCEGYGRSFFAGQTDSQVSDLMQWLIALPTWSFDAPKRRRTRGTFSSIPILKCPVSRAWFVRILDHLATRHTACGIAAVAVRLELFIILFQV